MKDFFKRFARIRSTQRIALLLTFVFLLPALFFSVYEISSLNREEEMMQEIYNKQLEAILFSVNQYSDDVLNSWISKIEAGIEDEHPDSLMPERISTLLTFYSSIRQVFIYDSANGASGRRNYTLAESNKQLDFLLDETIKSNTPLIQKLASYKRSGFQKVEALGIPGPIGDTLQCLVFITEDSNEHFKLGGIVINAETFINDMVGPRLQVIARDQFTLAAYRKGVSFPIYSTLTADVAEVESTPLTKDFWLFPNYSLGIRGKGVSIETVINERTHTNLFMLVSLDVILVIAVILVFINVKKEVALAQNKADFVSNVSHEIRTPLALISMFAETLELDRVKNEEKKREYYGIISKETQRLTGIVNKILNFSQTEANKKVLKPEPLYVSEVVKEILNTYDFHLKNKGFQYSFTDTHDLWIIADKEAFVEAFINLLDNAIKYSSDRKEITVLTGIENSHGLVIVKDKGIGIKDADQKHIFDKFYRVSSGDLAKSRGTGLGLSLVKQLMSAQNGDVTVYSAPGIGSTFTLHFPLQPNS